MIKFLLAFLLSLSLLLGLSIFYVEQQIKVREVAIFVEEPFVPSNIVVKVNTVTGPVNSIWRAFAQGGEEQGVAMLKPTTAFVKRLRPKYIRLDHIFDDSYYGLVVGLKGDGSVELNWSRLDETVNDILATGAKPFFSLSYMPGALSPSIIGLPNNWKSWQNLVRQTVEHYSSFIDNVYYEVWNEPSLPFFGDWKMYEPKDYRQLYYYSVIGAVQAQNVKPFRIGGPAIPVMDPRWIELLFDYVLDNQLRLDFISWHRYSHDPSQFTRDVEMVNTLLANPKYQRFSNVEKILSEWGPNSEKDTVYSSLVASSHALATLRQLLALSDYAFSFELKDGPLETNAGWGLLTHESVGMREKPRYYLFDWLSELEGERLVLEGEGSQISGFALKNDRTVSLILANYNLQKSIEETVQVNFVDLDGGRYRLLRQQLFSKPIEQEVEIGPGSLPVDIKIPSYSVARIILTKISNLGLAEEAGNLGELGKFYFETKKDRF